MINILIILLNLIGAHVYAWKNYPKYRYYFANFFMVGYMSLIAIVCIPFFILRGRSYENIGLKIPRLMVQSLSPWIGLKWTLRDPENFRKKSCCILVSNHQSQIDILGMCQYWPERMTVVGKKQVLYSGLVGAACWLNKMIFIDRQKRGNHNQIGDAMKELVKNEVKLWMFPEGTRRVQNRIHEFKKGAFYLAVQNQVPIQAAVFSSYSLFLDAEKKSYNSGGHVILTVLPQIETKGLTEEDIPQLMERVKMEMEKVFKESTEEVRRTSDTSKLL